MKHQKELNLYYQGCETIKEEFIQKYYVSKDIPREDVDDYWIADDIGGVLSINDYFHSMNDMVGALKLNCPKKRFFEWYDYSLENYGKEPMNLKSYLVFN